MSLIASKIGTNLEEKCCISGTNGCEIQAILDSAEYCSENGVHFNLTKYTSFVEEMIDFGKTKRILTADLCKSFNNRQSIRLN